MLHSWKIEKHTSSTSFVRFMEGLTVEIVLCPALLSEVDFAGEDFVVSAAASLKAWETFWPVKASMTFDQSCCSARNQRTLSEMACETESFVSIRMASKIPKYLLK